MHRFKTLIFIVTILVISACSPTQTSESTAPTELIPMTFMAGYKPQANLPFVGAYIAKEKGFFEQNGLDVTIEHSPGRGEHLQLLVAGTVQVTTMDAANLLERRSDPGVPVVSIALIGQKGQQAFAALSESGMQTPKDWEGKTVGYKGTPTTDLFALLAATDTDVDKIDLVNVGFDPRVLAEGQVDVYPLYKSNEPYLLNSWGDQITLWDASDYGVPTLGLIYAATESYVEENGDILSSFLYAALQGIRYAETHPDEAIEIVMKYAGPDTNPDHMKFMLETELEDAQSENGYGWQSAEQWQALANMLAQHDVLPADMDINQVFNSTILHATNK